MVAQARFVTDKFQLMFWHLMIQVLTKMRIGIYWMRGHFLGIGMLLLAATLLVFTVTSFSFNNLSNLPFINLLTEGETRKAKNYMVALYDDLQSGNPQFQMGWMVFQTSEPQPVKILKLIDQPDLIASLKSLNVNNNDQSHQILTTWMKDQNLDVDGTMLLDQRGLTSLVDYPIANSGDDYTVLNQWCQLLKTNSGQDHQASFNQSTSEGHIRLFGMVSVEDVFPARSSVLSDGVEPVCQIIQ